MDTHVKIVNQKKLYGFIVIKVFIALSGLNFYIKNSHPWQ